MADETLHTTKNNEKLRKKEANDMSKFGALIGAAIIVSVVVSSAFADGGTFRQTHEVSYGGSENADPISPNPFWQLTEKVMSRLIRPDAKGQPSPNLATSWSANENATEWTLLLREGVKFHDGSTFDGADVVYSFNRISDPKLDSPVRSVLAVVESVKAINPSTVKIKLSAGHADLPMLLMDYRIRIIPEGSGDTIATTGIGTGPFILETLDVEGTTVLKANPDYWEGAPKVSKIEIIGIPDAQARLQALLSGQVDMLRHLSVQDKAVLEKSSNFEIQSVNTGDWQGIAFRTDVKPFSDLRVRKALRIVADRQEMVNLVLGSDGGAVACDNPVWLGDQYRASIDCPQQVEEAKRLLAEAGFPDGIEIDVITSDLKSSWLNLVQVYQQQAAKAGIKVNLVKAAADGFWNDVWMKEPVVTTSWGQRPADQILNEAFRSTAKWNETFFKNAAFDKKLDSARQELDKNKRIMLYHDLQKILFDQGGTFIPFHLNQIVAVNKRVRGLEPVFDDGVRYHLLSIEE